MTPSFRSTWQAPYLALCLGLIFVLAATTSAARTTTTVPDKHLKPLEADSRLARQVELEAEGVPLRDLVASLSRETGITLTASRDVADEKVIVYAPARPLRDTLADLAAFLGAQWLAKRGTNGQLRYELMWDLATKRREADLLDQMQFRALHQAEEAVRALGETPAQLARRPEGDPVREQLTNPDGRTMVQFYAALNPAQRQTLRARKCLKFPFTSLPNHWQTSLRQVYTRRQERQNREFAEYNAAVGMEVYSFDNDPINFETQVVQIELSQQGSRSFFSINLWPSGEGYGLAMVDDRSKWQLPPHGDPFARNPETPEAPFPAGTQLPDARPNEAWPEYLRRLAHATRQPIISDYYRTPLVNRMAPDESKVGADRAEAPPRAAAEPDSVAALDSICHPVGYLWWTRGQALLLKKRDWYFQRQYEVPDRWLLDMTARLQKQNGTPRVRDLVRLLELSPEQISGLNHMAQDSGSVLGSDRRWEAGIREAVQSLEVWSGRLNDTIPMAPREVDTVSWNRHLQEKINFALSYPQMSRRQQQLALQLITTMQTGPALVGPVNPGAVRVMVSGSLESQEISNPAEWRPYYADYQTTKVLLSVHVKSNGSPESLRVWLPRSLPGIGSKPPRIVMK